MKLIYLILIYFLIPHLCLSQETIDSTFTTKNNVRFISKRHMNLEPSIIDSLDRTAVFESCDYLIDNRERELCTHKEFYILLSREIKYPRKAKRKGVEGHMIVGFDINKNGKIENVKIEESNDSTGILNKEAIRAVKKLPNLIPAIFDNRRVTIRQSFPLKFSLKK